MSNFSLEVENYSLKSRVGIYISNSLKYLRKVDLEGVDSNILSFNEQQGPPRCNDVRIRIRMVYFSS